MSLYNGSIFMPRHGEGLAQMAAEQSAREFEAHRVQHKIPPKTEKKTDYAPTPFNVIEDTADGLWFLTE